MIDQMALVTTQRYGITGLQMKNSLVRHWFARLL